MARYCFYCGTELAEGERCACREKMQANSFDPNVHKQAGQGQEQENASSNHTTTSQASGTSQDAKTSQANTNSQRTSTSSAEESTESRSYQAGSTSDSKQQGNEANMNSSKKTFRKNRARTAKKSFWQRFREKKEDWERNRSSSGKSTNAQGEQRYTNADASTRGPSATIKESIVKKYPFFSFLFFIHTLLTKPTKLVDDAKRASTRRIIIVNALSALCFAAMIFIFVTFSPLVRMSYLREARLQADFILRQGTQAFIRSFFVAGAFSFLRVLISKLVLRFIGRQDFSIRDMYRMFLAGSYYEILIILFSIFFVSSHGMRAIIMILAAYSIRSVIDYISFRKNIYMSEDKLLPQFGMIYVLFFVLLSFLINLAIPRLSSFDVLPEQEAEEFLPNIQITVESDIL